MTDDRTIERRLADHMSERIQQAAAEYLDDHDPITVRAMEYFGVTYNKVTPAMRRAVHQRGSEVYGCVVTDDLRGFKPHGWHRADM